MNERITREIPIRVPIECPIRSKIKLCDERLEAGCGHQIVDVLADTVRIMPWHHRTEMVFSLRVRHQRGTVAIAFDVVVAVVIGLPHFKGRSVQNFAVSIEHLPGHVEWKARIATAP
jgi:hypothetical protein